MNFVAEFDAELFGVSANLGGFGDESVLSFFQKIEVATCPEAPRVPGCQFPTEGDTPEHGERLHA